MKHTTNRIGIAAILGLSLLLVACAPQQTETPFPTVVHSAADGGSDQYLLYQGYVQY